MQGKVTKKLDQTDSDGSPQRDIEFGVSLILKGFHKAFNIDLSDKNFRGTPQRVARAYMELLSGHKEENDITKVTEDEFPSSYDGMIVASGIKCFSLCPHHLLPVEYIVNVGYIPSKKTVGISKLSRVVEILSKRLCLQEVFTKDIVLYLGKHLKPKGVIVQVKGRHFCMVMRGIKKDSWTMTSSITGAFRNPAVRHEFQILCT